MRTEKQLALDKERLARERLSPFVEAAMGQLIAEIPHTRSGYDLLRRIKARIDEACTKHWVPKKRPSKGRRRSQKDRAASAEWFRLNRREVRDEAAGTPNAYLSDTDGPSET
jgi:hypothetical protein